MIGTSDRLCWLAEPCKIPSGGCLERSGDRKFTVCLAVGTTVTFFPTGEIWVASPKPRSRLSIPYFSNKLVPELLLPSLLCTAYTVSH